jgi:hypothetical protein
MTHGNRVIRGNIPVVVDALFYTLLLRAGSFYVDAETRDRVLRAQRLGAVELRITPARTHETCTCDRAVVISLDEVLCFIAHDRALELPDVHRTVVPLRAFA